MKVRLVPIDHVLERITYHTYQPHSISRTNSEDVFDKWVFDDEEIKTDVKDPIGWAISIIIIIIIIIITIALVLALVIIDYARGTISNFAVTSGAVIIIIILVRSGRT